MSARLRSLRLSTLAAALCLTFSAAAAMAAEVKVAVAANFTAPAKKLANLFSAKTGHTLLLSFGSTGQLYNKIAHGAPFEVLLAADEATPRRIEAEGLGVRGSRLTYAIGKLVLYSRAPDLVTGEATLASGRFERIAIAKPATAPYGAAAVEVMKALRQHERLKPRIVQGNSIMQAFQLVETGNAEIGFVALSQVIHLPGGSRWVVPVSLYTPIAQDAVLLTPGAGNAAARRFLAFLREDEARAVIESFGYAIGG